MVLEVAGAADCKVGELPKGSGCKEHTNLHATPAARNKAQNSCAPVSRDPSHLRAESMNSSFEVAVEAFSCLLDLLVNKNTMTGRKPR